MATREVGAHVVHEDEKLFAFLDIHPIRPTHALIIPKQHFPYFDDLPAALAASVIALGQRLAIAMKRIYGVEPWPSCSQAMILHTRMRTCFRCTRRPIPPHAAISPRSS